MIFVFLEPAKVRRSWATAQGPRRTSKSRFQDGVSHPRVACLQVGKIPESGLLSGILFYFRASRFLLYYHEAQKLDTFAPEVA